MIFSRKGGRVNIVIIPKLRDKFPTYMSNPKLSYKAESTLTVNQNVKKLFQVIYQEQQKGEEKGDESPKIKVSEFISKMSFYYEKIRNAVDYKEEALLRKNAILRILKRLIVIEGAISLTGAKSENMAKDLLIELIRAGYLPNDAIPETKIGEIAAVIEKYARLKKYVIKKNYSNGGKNGDAMKWIIIMAACDIEERLGRSHVEKIIISNLYEILKAVIRFDKNSPYEEDKDIQIYIGIHRLMLKFDKDLVAFILLKYYLPNWRSAGEEEIMATGENIGVLITKINRQVEHPIAKQLNKIIKRYNGFYSILRDVIEENPSYVYETFRSDPKAFPRDIKKACEKKYRFAKKKLWRAAVRSIIYIFITKSVFAVALEVPATQWFGEELSLFALGVNMTFPAVLLFLAVLFTRLPSSANTEKIIEGINEIVFKEYERKEPFTVRAPRMRGKSLNVSFGIIYSVTFLLSFGLVVFGLDSIGFNFVSITIFLFFLAFVSFFALRIRKNAHELIVIEQKETIFSFLLDFFYTPIIAAGKYLSEKFSRINVFVFFLDFIIEAPFKILVEAAEEWTKYVKERKEELM